MIINKCNIVYNTIIRNVKKESPDNTCSEPSITMETGNIFETRILPIPRNILGKVTIFGVKTTRRSKVI